MAAGAAGAAAVTVVACQPVGGLNSSSVAITTDQTGTRALERAGVQVRWLSCTATVDNGDGRISANPRHDGTASASPTGRSVATVDCQGETDRGETITIKGRVTQEIDGRCVRGDLTARVGGRVVFQASVLGDCSRPPSDSWTPTGRPSWSQPGEPSDTASHDPSPTCDDGHDGHDGHGKDGHGDGHDKGGQGDGQGKDGQDAGWQGGGEHDNGGGDHGDHGDNAGHDNNDDNGDHGDNKGDNNGDGKGGWDGGGDGQGHGDGGNGSRHGDDGHDNRPDPQGTWAARR